MVTKRWSELSTKKQGAAGIATAIQLVLAASAWADLVRRPTTQVKGSKLAWAAIIGVNFIGPIVYFARGRSTSS